MLHLALPVIDCPSYVKNENYVVPRYAGFPHLPFTFSLLGL